MSPNEPAEGVAPQPEGSGHEDFLAQLDRKSLRRLRRSSHSLLTLGGLYIVLAVILFLFSFLDNLDRMNLASFLRYAIFLSFLAATAYSFLARPRWGRVFGYISMGLALLLYPVGTLFGLLGILALIQGGALFGSKRVYHRSIEREWRARKQRAADSSPGTEPNNKGSSQWGGFT